MERPLPLGDRHYSGFLQQITLNACPFYAIILSEVHLHVFPESARIVIPHCFAIPECLKQRIT